MDRICGEGFASRSAVFGRHGMAATSQPLATGVALDLLKAGGSAVDAAIGANAVLALVEPTGCGLGGDLFALLHDPEEEGLKGLNASGRSPLGLTLPMLQAEGFEYLPARGPLPISVPGCVDGWCQLSQRYGRLPLAEVLAPAVSYAREGAPITEVIAFHWQRGAAALAAQAGFAEVFLPAGRAPRAGEIFKNLALADSLERIGAEGRAWFYEGAGALEIERFVVQSGGYLHASDLGRHRSEWVTPVQTSYRGVELWELPPNGQGIAALQILNLLEGENFEPGDFGSARFVHAFVEAKKLAFEDRARLYADPDFAEVPVQRLISKDYARERWQLFDAERALEHIEASHPALERGDTINLSVADERGQMVSLIQSNYRGFGSGVTPPTLGFGLQDRGQMFDLQPGRPNSYAPGKRPFHTIIPAFLTRGGEPWCAFGVMGGDAQPQIHAQIVINLVDFELGLQAAGDAARILHRGSSDPMGRRMQQGGEVLLESGFSAETRRELERRGHRLGSQQGQFGGYQAVATRSGVLQGASEARKDGQASGY
ncbi:MAG: gamma-glutamyltransferase family protein [bacterium]|nr:gamma-glutamyltransferase family protein [Planctomycetota bacterium]HIL51403.1 gamma-glutamyltransferase family protein [Planctomycetota bacterium]